MSSPESGSRPASARPGGYARAASSGTRWITIQGVLNKLATAAAMLIVAQKLSPEALGLANVVMIACGFVMLLPIPVMGDVLITHQHSLATIWRATRRVTAWTTVFLAASILVTAPIIAWWYDQYPFWPVAVLLGLSAIRPIAEAMAVSPLTRLRVALRYREIAIANGVVQLGSATLTVLWAVIWPSAAAIVMPQVFAVLAKALWWGAQARRVDDGRVAARRDRVQRRPGLERRIERRIMRQFGTASFAQYIHIVLSGLPLIVVSRACDKDTTGQFSFAFTLANQTTMMIAMQLAIVLQPIFGRLKTDRARQIGGFMRVVATMAAVAVPVSLLQMALAEPLFKLFFPAKWLPAIPVFLALSAGQAFGFILAPSQALLKAQGRFGVYFLWQVVQTCVCLVAFLSVVAIWSGGFVDGAAVNSAAVARNVAWADTSIWLLTMPTIVVIGTRLARVGAVQVLRAFFTPWITATPIALAAWFAWRALESMPVAPRLSAAIAIVVVGPVAMLLSLLAIRFTQPAVAVELAPLMRRVLGRVPMIGRPLGAWFSRPAPESTFTSS